MFSSSNQHLALSSAHSVPMSIAHRNPAPIKVICLGLGRTGTASLRDALTTLGFGPCYHMFEVLQNGGKDFPAWSRIGDGDCTPEDLDAILRPYKSVLDTPPVMYPAELYAAYPEAKYILTTRDPAMWEKSMKNTILRVMELIDKRAEKTPLQEALLTWNLKYLQEKYHRGRIYTHTQEELLDHNERIKGIIPPEKLLVYEVTEGWDRLVEFLGVPKPDIPFPHLNDTEFFQEVVMDRLGVADKNDP